MKINKKSYILKVNFIFAYQQPSPYLIKLYCILIDCKYSRFTNAKKHNFQNKVVLFGIAFHHL